MSTRAVSSTLLCLITIIPFCNAGCSFQSKNLLPAVDMDHIKTHQPTTLPLSINCMAFKEDIGRHYDPHAPLFKNEFLEVLSQAGYLPQETPQGASTLHIDLQVTGKEHVGPIEITLAILSGMTFTAIPAAEKISFTVTCQAINAREELFEYEVCEEADFVIWCALLGSEMTKDPNKVLLDFRQHVYRNLIKRIQDDGLLVQTPQMPLQQV